MGDTAMEKQCVQRNELLDLDIPSIIFCISPDDPIIKHIKAGQKVTYDLVRGDNGQFYAVDIRLAQEEEIPNPIQASAFLL
jgi:Cu/Ag efflux protein CusF